MRLTFPMKIHTIHRMKVDIDLVQKVAEDAAQKAGDVLRSFHGKELNTRKKGVIDLVTEADTASEKVILETILTTFPHHSILAEESGRKIGDERFHWVIDPLDGTTNFAHRLGLYAVSIAFAFEGEEVVGIVLAPASGEMFSAVKGNGARLNGSPIGVSRAGTLADSLLVTGFPYNARERITPLISRFRECILAAQGIRRLGSAALDLCYVACGRFEGFWEENLKPWDTAAGVLIAREAGGRVTNFTGAQYNIEMQEILATNGLIHNEMIRVLTQDCEL
jgi:myo-inositol-1(or 4)-monophosphatase